MFQITPNGLTPINALSQTVMRLCLFIKLSSFICPVFLKGLDSPPLVEEKNKTYSAEAQTGTEPSAYYSTIFSKVSGPFVPWSILHVIGILADEVLVLATERELRWRS